MCDGTTKWRSTCFRFPAKIYNWGFNNGNIWQLPTQNIKNKCTWQIQLGGGFKYFLFSPLLGEDSHFDKHIFQMDWNHQLVNDNTHFWYTTSWFHCVEKSTGSAILWEDQAPGDEMGHLGTMAVKCFRTFQDKMGVSKNMGTPPPPNHQF